MLNYSANGPSGYNLTNSLRFRSSASASLSRTPSSAGSQTTWTWSAWVKRGKLGAAQTLFAEYNANNDAGYTTIYFGSNDKLSFTGFYTVYLETTQVFRDPSSWYHIILAVDTTQATSTNRIKLYVNGVQVTAFGTTNYPAQNGTFSINNTGTHYIGFDGFGSSGYLDGYLAEVNFVNAQQLTPSSFGNTNSVTGVWQPAKYTGTYGTNGFYLKFADTSAATAAAIGKDSSGNSNNWTPTNISVTAGTTYDAMSDVPTLTSATVANYATWNPLDRSNNTTYSQANLYAISTNNSAPENIQSTIQFPLSGKFYCEITGAKGAQDPLIGIGNNIPSAQYAAYRTNGSYLTFGISGATASGSGATWTTGDVIGIAYDIGAGTITFYKNGSAQTGGFTGIPATGYFIIVRVDSGVGGDGGYLNCGQRPFAYTPPTGFVALNTFNLPSSTIPQGNKVMDATLWTGDGTSPKSQTNAAGFKPDLVWIKSRSNAYSHQLYDSVRGTGSSKNLQSDTTSAEGADASLYGYLSAFNSNGFSTTNGSDPSFSSIWVNANGVAYVGWQWQAGQGSTSSNTAGSITSTVSVNATAGFSVVTYTGTGANATVGHGLGVAPKMIIFKGRSTTFDWMVYHTSLGNTNYLRFNQTNASAASSSAFNNTSPTSTVFSLGDGSLGNQSSATQVAYCWAEIAGFSKFGSYTGNGSADGTFVYTGFRPRFLIWKMTSSTSNWWMVDTARVPYNTSSYLLFANLPNVEYQGGGFDYDILSNGFKFRNSASDGYNASGQSFIYMAFAENPFKNALAR